MIKIPKKIKEGIAILVSLIFNAYITSVFPVVIAVFISKDVVQFAYIVILTIILLPFVQFILFYRLKLISDFDISNRDQRPLYLVFSSILYTFLYIWSTTTNIGSLIKISLALVIVTLFFTLISTFWKISGHMTYLLFSITSINFLFNSRYLALLYLLVPVVAWARIELKHHTLLQTILGTLTACAISLTIFAII